MPAMHMYATKDTEDLLEDMFCANGHRRYKRVRIDYLRLGISVEKNASVQMTAIRNEALRSFFLSLAVAVKSVFAA